MTITGTFSAGKHLLTVLADANPNNVTLSRNAGGTLFVNGGAVAIAGGVPTVADTNLIKVLGGGGGDALTFEETNGLLPAARLFGGGGQDTLTTGSAADRLNGQGGADTLFGNGGADLLVGGAGRDTLTGGRGNDQMLGGAGSDRMIWNNGDGTDLMEGGGGVDLAIVNGGLGAEIFTMTANGARVRFDRTDPSPFAIDIGTTEKLLLNAHGGDDSISANGNLAALVTLNIRGGAGNDTILAGNGADTLSGGDGIDFVDGNQGNDVALLGAGDDTFQWDPGDGNDVVEGHTGIDTLLFNGNGANENIDLAANGARLRFFRDVAAITMDLNSIERVIFNAGGGADNVSIHDLTGTGAQSVTIDLAAIAGGSGGGDSQVDTIFIDGTNGDDVINLSSSGGVISVSGLGIAITILNFDAGDRIVINALAGDDVVDASNLIGMLLTSNGGDGDDVLIGSAGDDALFGEAADDVLIGGAGVDVLDGGPGNNVVIQDREAFHPDL